MVHPVSPLTRTLLSTFAALCLSSPLLRAEESDCPRNININPSVALHFLKRTDDFAWQNRDDAMCIWEAINNARMLPAGTAAPTLVRYLAFPDPLEGARIRRSDDYPAVDALADEKTDALPYLVTAIANGITEELAAENASRTIGMILLLKAHDAGKPWTYDPDVPGYLERQAATAGTLVARNLRAEALRLRAEQ